MLAVTGAVVFLRVAMGATLTFEGIEEACRAMGDLAVRQIPFAASKALNATVKDAHAAVGHEIRDVFDRPTPFTQRSPKYERSTKSNLSAAVGVRDFAGKGTPASKYLRPHIDGGQRPAKRFEIALRRIGVLPRGQFAVPAAGAKLDAYGNMSRGQIVQILSYFQAFGEQGYRANMSAKGRKRLAKGTKKNRGVSYFVSTGDMGSGLRPGIYARYQFARGNAVKPVLIFVDRAMYEAGNFDFDFVVTDTVKKVFSNHLSVELGRAIATARR